MVVGVGEEGGSHPLLAVTVSGLLVSGECVCVVFGVWGRRVVVVHCWLPGLLVSGECVCVAAGGNRAYVHHALRKSAVETESAARRAEVHHQVRVQSLSYQSALEWLKRVNE